MYRIAYCSPLNPVASGISDYSEELLPYLGQYVEIDLFVDRGMTPSNANLRRALPVLPLDMLPARHARQPYAAVIYHMGNSPVHSAIYAMLGRVPGVVVLHDWVLHHFKLGYRAVQHDLDGYKAELHGRYGAAGRRAAERMLRGQLTDAVFGMPLNEDVLNRALGLIGHSHFLVERARVVRPELPVALVPMGVPLPPVIEPIAARTMLGLGSGPIWASFGHINPYKRVEPALQAFRQLRTVFPQAQYLLVGSVSPHYDLDSIIKQLGLTDAVMVTGYVPPPVFNSYVAAAELCLNLRYPTAGETSASLLRLLAAGRPTLVSATDAFLELPDAVCPKVDPDRSEQALIYHYAHLLHTTPALAVALGANARAFVAREHTLPRAAQEYVRFLAQLYGWALPEPSRPTLWEVLPEPFYGSTTTSSRPGPMSSSSVTLDPALSSVAQALTALGVTTDDDLALGDIAAIVTGLLT
ncbi:MAG: glycosyltransferase [Herpetosiphonaceae bacterium]|nr:glycosyltransferase [Herpetosiphonaceae bacterium]